MSKMEVQWRFAQPFPGLRPFQQEEADLFFGRGEQIDALLATLEDHNVVAVVGASGSGKSSLVRAGLLPALEAGFLSGAGPVWRMIVMRPGTAPFSQLAEALLQANDPEQQPDPQQTAFVEATLRSGPQGLLEALDDLGFPAEASVLVLVDQFEEIFRFRHRETFGAKVHDCPSAAIERNDATAFVNMLLATAEANSGSLYTVITMRSDFLGDCDAFHGLPEAINQCQFLVPRLRRDQVRDTIVMPLDLFGASAEPSLVSRILNEIGSDPDQLPLMQHLLHRMWKQAADAADRQPVVLRLSDYDAVGGLENALSRHADEVFDELADPEKQRVAELMFRALCNQEGEARLTRRLVTVSEVAAVAGVAAERVQEVAGAFLRQDRSFLVHSPRGELAPASMLDISHEALIRQWTRLTEWVAVEARSTVVYRRIAETARLWTEGKASFMVSPELDIALNWRTRQKPTRVWAERYGGEFELSMKFLDASRTEQASQRERERREARRKSLFLFSTLAVVSILMLTAGFLWRNSERQATELNELFIESQLSLGTASIREGRMGEGLLRYWSAYQSTRPGHPSRQSSLDLIAAWSKIAGRPLVHDRGVRAVTYSNDGSAILTVTTDTATLWDVASGEPFPFPMTAQGGFWQAIAVSPVATNVLVADGTHLSQWDLRSGERIGQPFTADGRIASVSYTADGKRALTRTSRMIQLWDLANGTPCTAGWPADQVRAFSLDGDGQTALLVGPSDCRLIDVATGRETPIPGVDVAKVEDARLSPDGTTMITLADHGAQLWRLQVDPLHGVDIKHHRVETVAYRADSEMVLVGSADNTARIWSTRTGEPVGPSLRHQGTVTAARFSADGEVVLTGSADNSARLWDVETGGPLTYAFRHAGTVTSLAFSPDQETFLTGSVDGMARLWQRRVRKILNSGTESYKAGVFSPDGQVAAIVGDFHSHYAIGFFDLETERPSGRRPHTSGKAHRIAFAPDGRRLLTSDGRLVTIWDARTREIVPTSLGRLDGPVHAVAFGVTGDELLVAGNSGTRLWDLRDASRPRYEFPHQAAVLAVAMSPDGSKIVTGDSAHAGQLWDVASGQRIGPPLRHGDAVEAVAFSPDGRLVATGSADNTAAIWDASTGELLVRPMAHRDAITDLMFSPNGATLLTASEDTRARLWDVSSGELLGDPVLHAEQVRTARFDPQGRRVLTIDDDGSAWLWDVVAHAVDDPVRLRLSLEWRTGLHFATVRAVRRLTQQEWLDRQRRLRELGGPGDVGPSEEAGTP